MAVVFLLLLPSLQNDSRNSRNCDDSLFVVVAECCHLSSLQKNESRHSKSCHDSLFVVVVAVVVAEGCCCYDWFVVSDCYCCQEGPRKAAA